MDENDYTRPIKRKPDKHFDIRLNGKRVKILNYKIRSQDNRKEEFQILEIATKISNEGLRDKNVHILIERENKLLDVKGSLCGVVSQPGLSKFQYRVESYQESEKDAGP